MVFEVVVIAVPCFGVLSYTTIIDKFPEIINRFLDNLLLSRHTWGNAGSDMTDSGHQCHEATRGQEA
jgi:hypothetical protein